MLNIEHRITKFSVPFRQQYHPSTFDIRRSSFDILFIFHALRLPRRFVKSYGRLSGSSFELLSIFFIPL